MAGKIAQFLNGLPSGISFQLVQEIGPGNVETIDGHGVLAECADDSTSGILCQERMNRLKELESSGLIPRHGLRVFVRRPLSGLLLEKPKLFSKTKLFQPIAEDRFKREIERTTQLREDFAKGLEQLGIVTQVLKADAVADLIYWQWNAGRRVPRGQYDPEDVRSSLLFTDVGIYEKGFSLGGIHHRVVSLKLLPDNTFASMATVLNTLPFDSKLFLTVFVPDQQRELSSLQTQRRIAFSMARGKRNGVSDIESEAKFQDLEGLIEQMVAQGEKVFHVSLNVVLRGSDQCELDDQVSKTLMTLRELGGAEGMEESLASLDIFAELAIPNARAMERQKKVKTSNLCDLLPLYGGWSGHTRPSILLRSRMGGLVRFDPFDKGLSNYNQIVSGGSGSGKSFLTNILLLHMLKENPRIFVVDIGGSYKKLTDNLSGQYIPLSLEGGYSLNPFDIGADTVPSSQKIKFLLGLVELMTKEDDETHLPRLERAEIEEAIQRTYDTVQSPRLSDLRERLLSHPSAEIKRYGKILTPWCADTPFGKFVDRETTIALEKSIVSFDLKGLEMYPDLQAVVLFIITDFVWRKCNATEPQKSSWSLMNAGAFWKTTLALRLLQRCFEHFVSTMHRQSPFLRTWMTLQRARLLPRS